MSPTTVHVKALHTWGLKGIRNRDILAAAGSIALIEGRHAGWVNTLVGDPITLDDHGEKPAVTGACGCNIVSVPTAKLEISAQLRRGFDWLFHGTVVTTSRQSCSPGVQCSAAQRFRRGVPIPRNRDTTASAECTRIIKPIRVRRQISVGCDRMSGGSKHAADERVD